MSNEKNFTIAPMFQNKLTNPDDYTFCGVFGDETDEENKFSYLYSINLTQKLQAELILCGRIIIHALYPVVCDYIEVHKGLPIEGEMTLPGVYTMVNGEKQNIRIYVKEVTGEPWLDTTILNRCTNFNKVYQIYFGDKENKLPTDEGNTDPIDQVRMKKLPLPAMAVNPS